MTRDEFNTHKFGANDFFKHEDGEFRGVCLNFDEGLIGLDMFDDVNDLYWVRCESVELVIASN